jgi:hypothetical protein
MSLESDGAWVSIESTRQTNRGTERRKRYMMYVIPTFDGADPTSAQQTLKRSIDLVAKTRQPRVERRAGQFDEGHAQNFRLVKDRDVVVQCYVAHILRMSGKTPYKSKWWMWDDRPVDNDTLRRLLNFTLDPDTLKPLEAETMHKPRVKEPVLFDIGSHALDDEDDDE